MWNMSSIQGQGSHSKTCSNRDEKAVSLILTSGTLGKKNPCFSIMLDYKAYDLQQYATSVKSLGANKGKSIHPQPHIPG